MVGRQLFFALVFASLLFSGLGVFVVSAMSSGDKGESAPILFYQHANGLGAGGYDVVAYFEEHKETKGDPDYATPFGGMVWHFSNKERLDKFVANPGKYLPQYGGHCAYAVANGYLASGDPRAWSIKDGRLYFNYNKSVRRAWLADADGFIRQSENNWPRLSK